MKIFAIYVLFHVFFLATAIYPQSLFPTGGPIGGDVRAFSYAGTNILAATQGGGVYQLAVNKWIPANSGLSGYALFVNDFARSNTDVFIATFNGVYVSTDDGSSWERRSAGLPNAYVLCIERHQDILYAGLDSGGVFRSTDDGLSWHASNQGLAPFIPVAVMTFIGEYVFAGTSGDGVYFTSDQGVHWTSLSIGIPQYTEYITSLYAFAGNVYAGIYNYGIYALPVTGGWWEVKNSGLTSASIFAFSVLSTTMYCGTENGVHYSTDFGSQWINNSTGMRSKRVRALFSDGGSVYAGTYGNGIYQQTGRANPWHEYNEGMTASIIQRLDLSSPYDGKLYASTFGHGAYRLDTVQHKWTEITTGLSDDALEVNRILFHGDTLYMATNGGFYFSTDRGENWSLHDWGMGTQIITAVYASGDTVYAGTYNQGLYRSTDFSKFWVAFNWGFPTPAGTTYPKINAICRQGHYLYLAMDAARMFRLNTMTQTWDSIQTTGLGLSRIIEVQGNDSILYAAGWGGVYFSRDHGITWHPDTLGIGQANVRTYKLAAGMQFSRWNHAQLCTYDGRLFIQDVPYGAWRQEPLGSDGFAIDHAQMPSKSYVGFYGKGVYSTGYIPVELSLFRAFAVDRGTNALVWETASETNNAGFEVQRSSDGVHFEYRAFVPGKGNTAEAQWYEHSDETDATAYYRLKQIDFDGTASFSPVISVTKEPQPGALRIEAYPNPFVGETTISFQSVYSEPVTLRISDALGRIVAEMKVRGNPSGYYTFTWNGYDISGNQAPPGVYLCSAFNAEGRTLAAVRLVRK